MYSWSVIVQNMPFKTNVGLEDACTIRAKTCTHATEHFFLQASSISAQTFLHLLVTFCIGFNVIFQREFCWVPFTVFSTFVLAARFHYSLLLRWQTQVKHFLLSNRFPFLLLSPRNVTILETNGCQTMRNALLTPGVFNNFCKCL